MYWETNFWDLDLCLCTAVLYCVPISEGPLSEVPLYYYTVLYSLAWAAIS